MGEPSPAKTLPEVDELRRARAERDVLLELMGVFTHDLSNPLQSLTVLVEIALDDAEPGSDAYHRAQQSLDAAERMRALIHGMVGFSRGSDGPLRCGGAVERVVSVLSRRFERNGIRPVVDLRGLDELHMSSSGEYALCGAGLAFIATAAEVSRGRFELRVQGRPVAGGGRLRMSLVRTDEGQPEQPVHDEQHLRRISDLVRGDPNADVDVRAEAIEIGLKV